ncbi:MAG: hypothetical protein Q8K45_22495 [Rubrivivax sp.]|nr:hypothetical protein [Rubrivivax sp.]
MKFLIMVFAAAMCAGAWGGPITLPRGPLYFSVRTAEQYSKSNDISNSLNPAKAAANEGNWGIVEVDSIAIGNALMPPGWQINSMGPMIFSNGNGPQILGIFYGVQNNPSGVGRPVTSKGGTMDLYFWESNIQQDVGTELASGSNGLKKRSGPAGNQYTGFTCSSNTVDCTLLARFDFSAGADLSSQVNTIYSPPFSSIFDAYLSVDINTPGAWTAALASNYFSLNPAQQVCGVGNTSCTSANDIRADGTFTQSGTGDWNISDTDIVGLSKDGALRAFVVPEPDALMLTALALVALGVAGGRRYDSRQPI